MSFLDALQARKGDGGSGHPDDAVKVVIPLDVDLVTCKRVGILTAYGMADAAIAAALLLSHEQLIAAKQTKDYQEAYAKQVGDRAQRAIDLEEGWDSVEEQALGTVLQALQHNRDPKFALAAAFTANKANRRSPAQAGRVIDASKANNIILLTMNKTYIQNVASGNGAGSIDVGPRDNTVLSKKQHDIPTPKRVGELLQIKGNGAGNTTQKNELLEACERAGVAFDMLDGDE